MEFSERTLRVIIDRGICRSCITQACVAACAQYDRGILTLVDGLPAVTLGEEELKRRGTECLACEEACRVNGKGALRIDVPFPGLEAYRRSPGTLPARGR